MIVNFKFYYILSLCVLKLEGWVSSKIQLRIQIFDDISLWKINFFSYLYISEAV